MSLLGLRGKAWLGTCMSIFACLAVSSSHRPTFATQRTNGMEQEKLRKGARAAPAQSGQRVVGRPPGVGAAPWRHGWVGLCVMHTWVRRGLGGASGAYVGKTWA